MTAHCQQSAFVKYRDPVGIPHRCQPVSNHQGSPALRERRHGPLNQVLAFRIQGAGGFIKQQNRSVGQQRTGNRQSLFLATGKALAGITQGRVVTLWQGLNKFVGVGNTGGLLDLSLIGLGPGVAQIIGDSAMKQGGILRHQSETPSQVSQWNLGGVYALQPDRTVL